MRLPKIVNIDNFKRRILECPFCAQECYEMLYFAHSFIFKILIISAILVCSFPWQSKGHRFESDILHLKKRIQTLDSLFSFKKIKILPPKKYILSNFFHFWKIKPTILCCFLFFYFIDDHLKLICVSFCLISSLHWSENFFLYPIKSDETGINHTLTHQISIAEIEYITKIT